MVTRQSDRRIDMSKFNVGDKIVRVADEYPQYGMYIGKVYTVKEIEDDYRESISVEEIPDKYWLEEYFELHYESAKQPQSEQECPYCIIEELSAQVDNLEELVSDQANQINQLTKVLDNFTRLTHYFSTEGSGKLPKAKLGDDVVDAILGYFEGESVKPDTFEPVTEYTLDDWQEAANEGWEFQCRNGDIVTILLVDDSDRPVLCSNRYYHHINGMWDESEGEDSDDIIRRIK